MLKDLRIGPTLWPLKFFASFDRPFQVNSLKTGGILHEQFCGAFFPLLFFRSFDA
ncbi:conserved domain protein [Parasutterella excrementihominis YIT 11859]|uniref:Conserved domain protein n=1 Tax=Parasutterella excrementihominis YIT 11859 TaxID=762966 RepID=F3QNC7_9BURK|nr:conserved domain protein [Parasutterella excrementihominis YIT 11859]